MRASIESTAGGKLWRRDYRFAGKRKTLSFGAYPAVSLKEARTRRDAAKERLAKGCAPNEEKKKSKTEAIAQAKGAARTFKVVADDWLDVKKDSYAAMQITTTSYGQY